VSQPTKDSAGSTCGFTLTFHDVTQEREVSRMKSDFVSFVTHQLRTPLAGIRWMLELAAQDPDVPADAASYVQDAREAAQRLIQLVNDLLDISRLERGKLTVTATPTDLGELTRGVLAETAGLVQAKGHRVSLAGDADAPHVLADPQLLRQVVVNLVSNAIKYTPEAGTIEIRLEPDGPALRWSIRDSGIGVPALSKPKLFDKFYRADNVVTLETEGTGLGLYLVRLIMEHLGGRVWCQSEEGAGATFLFTLPRVETTG
jgi:signal transduction histidine kinase